MHQHLSETSQERGDRLLAAYQRARNERRARRMTIELSGDPLPEPSRWRRIRSAVRPWVVGFRNPYMDALWLAFMLYFVALLTAFAAMQLADHRAPQASTAFSADEAAPRPAAIPLGGGATGEGR